MSGYNGYSMSNNACDAYASGEMPYSKWTALALSEELEFDINLIKFIGIKKIKEAILYCSSWHHTSKFYNATDFYSISSEYANLTETEFLEAFNKTELEYSNYLLKLAKKDAKIKSELEAENNKKIEVKNELSRKIKLLTKRIKREGFCLRYKLLDKNILERAYNTDINTIKIYYDENATLLINTKNGKEVLLQFAINQDRKLKFNISNWILEELEVI